MPRRQYCTMTQPNTFAELGKELWARLMMPRFNFTYWTHLLMGVCFYSSIGVWAEVLRRFVLGVETENDNILLAMHVTYPAVIGATAMQLLLNKEQPTYMRAFAQLVSTIFFSLAAVSILAANASDQVLLASGLFGNVCALLFWWTANARDEGLKGDVDPYAPLGGLVSEDVAPIAGPEEFPEPMPGGLRL